MLLRPSIIIAKGNMIMSIPSIREQMLVNLVIHKSKSYYKLHKKLPKYEDLEFIMKLTTIPFTEEVSKVIISVLAAQNRRSTGKGVRMYPRIKKLKYRKYKSNNNEEEYKELKF